MLNHFKVCPDSRRTRNLQTTQTGTGLLVQFENSVLPVLLYASSVAVRFQYRCTLPVSLYVADDNCCHQVAAGQFRKHRQVSVKGLKGC